MSAPTQEFLPVLEIHAPQRQRRWTVLLRGILLIPQFIVLFVLGIAAGVVVFISWFAALGLGRLPDWSAEFLAGYLAYHTRVYAYSYLLVDTYPPFRWEPADHPVAIRLAPGRLNRLAVFFRLLLVIPAAIVLEVVSAGWAALAFFLWLIVLVLGRVPQPVFGATAALARYEFRLQAYMFLLTSAYPRGLFGEEGRDETASSDTHPLRLSSGARTLLVVFIILGVLGVIGGSTESATQSGGTTQTVSDR